MTVNEETRNRGGVMEHRHEDVPFWHPVQREKNSGGMNGMHETADRSGRAWADWMRRYK